ncbi:MAG TPA: hypothetical protein VNX40_07400 [Mucilaginibacter sp.]|jgi:hypothetical protein|nr:hypothetical protein [Mucilaginibacter sp.]
MTIYSRKQFFNTAKTTAVIVCNAFLFFFAILNPATGLCQDKSTATVEMIFTSDAHFGITRKAFRGDTNVISDRVNKAMIAQMNSLPSLTFPSDGGVDAGNPISGIDYLIEGGDIANRMEIPIQSAATSFAQFSEAYFKGITLKGHDHQPTQFLIVPGNHDISNAIGFHKPMQPLTDPSSMVNIYNLMLKPAKPMTNDAYNYATDKINYSRDIRGLHFMFITLWPDSAERIWMEKDLATVSNSTPVIVVCHDQPTCEAKHFTNPAAGHTINKTNKFENLTAEYYKEGYTAAGDDGSTDIEQRGWVKFLKAHPNIKAYFHGNSNWNEFYVYKGPDNDVALPVFRVDSPMKGKYSAKDETKVSFQLISIDPINLKLTARECLWNTNPSDPAAKVVFGESKTISLN